MNQEDKVRQAIATMLALREEQKRAVRTAELCQQQALQAEGELTRILRHTFPDQPMVYKGLRYLVKRPKCEADPAELIIEECKDRLL